MPPKRKRDNSPATDAKQKLRRAEQTKLRRDNETNEARLIRLEKGKERERNRRATARNLLAEQDEMRRKKENGDASLLPLEKIKEREIKNLATAGRLGGGQAKTRKVNESEKMPPKRKKDNSPATDAKQKLRRAEQAKVRRHNETDEARLIRLENGRERQQNRRATARNLLAEQTRMRRKNENDDARLLRLEKSKERERKYRATPGQLGGEQAKTRRANESEEAHLLRLKTSNERNKIRRKKEMGIFRPAKEVRNHLHVLGDEIRLRIANETREERLERLQSLLAQHKNGTREHESDCLLELKKVNGEFLAKFTNKERLLRLDALKNRLKMGFLKVTEEENVLVSLANQAEKEEREKCILDKQRERFLMDVQKPFSRCIGIAESNDVNVTEHYCGTKGTCRHCQSVNFSLERPTGEKNDFGICCEKGNVAIPSLKPFPELLVSLMTNKHPDSANFMEFIRNINSAFAFASMGGKWEQQIGGGSYCFRVQGQLYHNTSVLYPSHSGKERYAQIYVLDPTDAIICRCDNEFNKNCRAAIMEQLEVLLRSINPYAKSFKRLGEIEKEEILRAQSEGRSPPQIQMTLTNDVGEDLRRYNPQLVSEVAMVFESNDGAPPINRSYLTIKSRAGPGEPERIRIKYFDGNCDPMVYPLFFPHGELGWYINLKKENKKVTMQKYYAYRLCTRINENKEKEFNPLLNGGKLTQQFIVDAYCKIEADRLAFIAQNQDKLRVASYSDLQRFLDDQGDTPIVGRNIILPSSFVGSPRAMQQRFQDAMAIVGKYGKPDLFITFTCNPKWKEITENLEKWQKSQHRPDLLARVFHMKLKELIHDLTKKCIFGVVAAYVYSIEFQKRGLPHAHILLILRDEDKFISADRIDKVVCAEIPDPEVVENQSLYQTVLDCMIHGPCGEQYPNAKCMKEIEIVEKGKCAHPEDIFICNIINGKCIFNCSHPLNIAQCNLLNGKCTYRTLDKKVRKKVCSKSFPKPEQMETTLSDSGYPLYKRRHGIHKILKTKEGKSYEVDSSFVVPYNRYLLLKYNAHINVEVCTTMKVVKYLFKYVYKGYDCANIALETDEIKRYLNARYVSAPEAIWRIFEFPMYKFSHSVERLPVHLPFDKSVPHFVGKELSALERAQFRDTKLEAYFKENSKPKSKSRNIFYADMPLFYTWQKTYWKARERNVNKISRMYNVSPSDTEKFYLRLLLQHVKGAKSYEHLRTVKVSENLVVCDTFKEACCLLNLLDDDTEWENCLREASLLKMPQQIRQMFAYILLHCEPHRPIALWKKFQDDISEDYFRRINRNGVLNEEEKGLAYDNALLDISDILGQFKKLCSSYGLPDVHPNRRLTDTGMFDRELERQEYQRLYPMLNIEQKEAFDKIIRAVDDDTVRVRLFYLDGPGGSGKTFLYNAVMAKVRSNGYPVIAVAWSGIAANLLKGGTTSHYRFGIPVPVNESSTCYIKPEFGKLVRDAKLILWDEATMIPLNALRAVDRVLRDIMEQKELPFGGKVVLFGGDFRQTLPVVKRGGRTEIIENCITKYECWGDFVKLKLNVNMRTGGIENEFSQWLLKLGDGKLTNDCLPPDYVDTIEVSPEFLVDDVVDAIFGQKIAANEVRSMAKRAILCTTNKDVLAMNTKVLDRIEGPSKTYFSVDSIVPDEKFSAQHFPVEYLNSLTPNGLAPHKLILKVGAIIMLLRNIDYEHGLCNGTRLLVLKLHNYAIEAEILDGSRAGHIVLLPRISINPSDADLPFTLKRRQFPTRVSFAMTINKSQGQSLERVGIMLRQSVFGHGQAYVAFSRCTSKEGVKVQIADTATQGKLLQGSQRVFTKNVVFREIFIY